MSDELRAIPDDPSQAKVRGRLRFIEAQGQAWFASAAGDYQTYAVDAHAKDGSGWHPLIALEWPGRPMGTSERTTLRILMEPEDAEGLAETLIHTARWLRARAKVLGPSDAGGIGGGKT